MNRNDLAIRQQFREDFRVTPDTFSDIVTLVRNRLEEQDTRFREALSIEKRVAITLWPLATGSCYPSVSKTFAVGKSTAVSITKSFCAEISRLSKYFIKFSRTPGGTAKAIATFKETTNCKIPQALGAIDGVHITILSPHTDRKVDYYNRKQEHTINSVVRGNLLFLDFCNGVPGSVHDSRILRNSVIYAKAESSQILNFPIDVTENVTIRPFILGNGGYPLLTWLMRPCNIGQNIDPRKAKFNKKLCGVRVTIERGFWILKARWRCLLKRLDSEIKNVLNVIITCVALRNMCQFSRDEYLDENEVLEQVLRQEREARQRRRRQNNANPSLGANLIRYALESHIDKNY